jgi:hypothetical protein
MGFLLLNGQDALSINTPELKKPPAQITRGFENEKPPDWAALASVTPRKTSLQVSVVLDCADVDRIGVVTAR